MKILQLEILNLASLDKQGGEVINFVKGALGESTIFSIVGPTGSGKSTILDAICLALYNRAPRYPRKKNERQRIEIYGQPDIMEATRPAPTDCRNILTRGKKEGYSKLTFQANNGMVYRAEWYVRFKRKNYEGPITVLYKITSSADGTPKEETAYWDDLPNIIGLEYEQFLRTVLIAQGSFANFLTAKEDERYTLLEKLIGCEEMYVRIASEIKRKKDAAIENFNIVNASVETVKQNLLSEEELHQLKEEIFQLEKAEKEIEIARKNVEAQLRWYVDNETIMADIKQKQIAVDQAKQDLEEFQPFIYRLNLHDAIAPAVDCMKDINKMENVIGASERRIEEDELKSKNQENLIVEANDLLKLLKETAEKVQQTLQDTEPHVRKARELKTKVDAANVVCSDKLKTKTTAEKEKNCADEALQKNIIDTQIKQNQADKAIEDYQAMLSEVDKKKEKLNRAADDAEKALLTELLKVEGMDAQKLQDQKEQADNDWQNLKRALEVVGFLNKAIEEKKQKETRKKELEEKNANLSELLAQLCIDALDNEVKTLRKAHTLMTCEDWGKHRASLDEGKPCPLCGATVHPYIADETQFDEATSELYTLLQNKEAALKKQQDDQREWISQKVINDAERVSIVHQIQELQANMEEYEKEWQSLLNWNPQMKKDKAALESALPSYKQKKEDADSILSFFNKEMKEIGRLTKEKDKAMKKKADHVEEAASLLAKAQEIVNTANTKLAEAKALYPTLLQQQEEKLQALNEASKAWQQADDALKDLQAAYQSELGGESPDVVEQRLKKDKENADAAVNQKKEEIAKMNASLGELKGALQTQKVQLEKDKQSFADKKDELRDWIAQYNDREDRIQEISQEDVEAMFHATEDWNAIRQEKDRRNDIVVSSFALLKNAKDAHDKHQNVKPKKEREILLVELQELQNNTHNDELLAAKARLRNHDDAIKLLGDKVEELNRVTKMRDAWGTISEAIGGDGKTLRKIAQCYTLSFLIQHANVEIRKFNSRYELKQVKNSLGIRVIDHDRADDVRDTTSLSGGETFIVSLGLALGLSSLSSRNISFENLFIDEGFGTLDPDTLATVIDSLAMLQSSQGKKVGVISHTNTMSERITTQIRIIKNGSSGSSHIEIYP